MPSFNIALTAIYLDERNVFISKELLKKLRAGGRSEQATLAAIAIIVVIIASSTGNSDGLMQLFKTISSRGVSSPYSPQTYVGKSSTRLSLTPEQERLNELWKSFNEKQNQYDFVMSEAEAKTKVDSYYSGQIEVSETEVITELRAAKKSYHASQLGINPKDYGVNPEDLQVISKIGIYKYAQTGRPLPPVEFVRAYQQAIKNIVENGKSMDIDYHSEAQKTTHPAKCYFDKKTGKVAVFYKNDGQLLTSLKYREKHFLRLLETKSLGRKNW